MDGWMDGWMDGRMGRMNGWMGRLCDKILVLTLANEHQKLSDRTECRDAISKIHVLPWTSYAFSF